MSKGVQDMFVAVVFSFGIGTVGAALAILWTTLVHRHWPDRDTILGLMKIFYAIGSLAVISYLIFKYL